MLKRFIGIFGQLRSVVACCVTLLSPLVFTHAAHAAVPVIVASSEAKFAHGSMSVVTKVVMDGNGNLFTVDEGSNTLWGIPAGSTTPIKLITGLNYSQGLAVDQYNDLIVSSGYGGNAYFITAPNVAAALAGGSIGSYIDLSKATNFSALTGYYSGFPDVAVDNNGVVYMGSESCNCGYSAIFSVQTQGLNTTSKTIGTAQLVIASIPKNVTSLATDTSSHLFYADGSNVYEILLTATPKVAVKIGSGFSAPTGVTVDSSGNLFVSDNNTGLLSEIPNENGTLNPADQFIVGPSPSLQYGVAFDRSGNFYAADVYNSGSINKVTVGAMNMGSLAVGSTSSYQTLTLEFNAAVAISSIAPYQGHGAATEFAQNSYTTCSTTSTTNKLSSCILQYSFTPASTGFRTGAVVIQSAGKPVATAYLAGIGSGAAMTFDPGTQAPVTGSAPWQTPSAVALDGQSNIYVADSTANTVQVLSSAGVPIASIGNGLKKPGGVAVDGAGNVLISDTGNNRVVEVPNEGGTLNTADQIVVVGTGLSSPNGIFVGPFGGVYVADTGNSRVLRLSTYEGYGLVNITTVGSGFIKPEGVATDSAGNVYVTDASANAIIEVSQTTGAVTTALSNLSTPTAIAFDIGGSAYFVNSGTNSVLRVPNVNGALNANTQLALGSLSLLKTPSGVAVNGTGNVAIADAGVPNVFTLVRTTGSLQFGSVDTSQSSISQTLTLTSAGTTPLTLGATPYTAVGATASFAVTTAAQNGCTPSSTMAVGSSCGYAAVFSPVATGPLTDTLVFNTNAVNSTILNALLTGTGTNLPQSTTTLSVSPLAPTYGQQVTVTAIVTPGATSTQPPTGTLTFYVNGIPQPPSTLSKNAQGQYVATFTFPPLALTASTNSMGANYNGDANNSSSHAAPYILVIAREPNTTTEAVYPSVAQPVNSPFTFTGVVTPSALGTPTGSMILVVAGTTTAVAGPVTISPIAVNGATVYGANITYTPPGGNGDYQYQIIYSGDVNFLPSTSGAITASYRPVGYTITLPSTSFTVTDGQSIQIPVTLTGISGYTGNLTVGAVNTATLVKTAPCTGLPSYVTCTFSPGYVQLLSGSQYYPNANPTAVIMMTVTTSVPPPTLAGGSIPWLGALAGTLALVLAIGKRRNLMRSRLMSVLLLVALSGLALGVSGCGSGTSSLYSTPRATSAITLTISGTGLLGPTILPAPGTGTNQVPGGNPDIVNTSTFSLSVQ